MKWCTTAAAGDYKFHPYLISQLSCPFWPHIFVWCKFLLNTSVSNFLSCPLYFLKLWAKFVEYLGKTLFHILAIQWRFNPLNEPKSFCFLNFLLAGTAQKYAEQARSTAFFTVFCKKRLRRLGCIFSNIGHEFKNCSQFCCDSFIVYFAYLSAQMWFQSHQFLQCFSGKTAISSWVLADFVIPTETPCSRSRNKSI